MTFRTSFNALFFIVLSLLAQPAANAAPSPAPIKKLRVLTSLCTLAEITEAIGGNAVEVSCQISGDRDPHFFNPGPGLLRTLESSDLVVRAGLGLEDSWLTPLVIASANESIQEKGPGDFNGSLQVAPIDAPKDRNETLSRDLHGAGNPHYWLDPRNLLTLSKGLALKLGTLRPELARTFETNADTWNANLKKKITDWEKLLKPLTGKSFISYHAGWTYLMGWTGIVDSGSIEKKPGIPPAMEDIEAALAMIRERKPSFLIADAHDPITTTEALAKTAGLPLLHLPSEIARRSSDRTAQSPPPAGPVLPKTYIEMMDQIVKQIAQATATGATPSVTSGKPGAARPAGSPAGSLPKR